MDIFESLENLNISEECFNDIMDIVEEIISERDAFTRPRAAKNSLEGRRKKCNDAYSKYSDLLKKDEKDQDIPNTDVNYIENVDGKIHHVYGYDEDDNMHRTYVPASPNVQKAYGKVRQTQARLDHAEEILRRPIRDSFRAEEEHQKKVQQKKMNK
jgi:hypothetical protein